ncbi:MAG: hypothetical protein ACTSWY_11090 [Promethearchaeota archaeon]
MKDKLCSNVPFHGFHGFRGRQAQGCPEDGIFILGKIILNWH